MERIKEVPVERQIFSHKDVQIKKLLHIMKKLEVEYDRCENMPVRRARIEKRGLSLDKKLKSLMFKFNKGV